MATPPIPASPDAPAFASTLQTFQTASGKTGKFFSLPALAKQFPNVSYLPVPMRIVLESVLRNCDGKKVTAAHVEELANWAAKADATKSRCLSHASCCRTSPACHAAGA